MTRITFAAIFAAFLMVTAYGQTDAAPESLQIKVIEASEKSYTQTLTTSQIEVDGKPLGEQRTAITDPVEATGKVVAVLELSGFDAANSTVQVVCMDSDCESYEVAGGMWVFTTPGTHKTYVSVTNWKTQGVTTRFIDVKVGKSPNPPPGPDPGPGPTPGPVPVDNYGNIGQRVAGWVSGLPKRTEVSQLYKNAANELLHTPIATIVSVTTKIGTERAAVLGPDAEKWKPAFTQIQADLESRWPLSKGSYAEYLLAISRGMDGAK